MSSPHDTIDEMKELIRQQDDIIRQYQEQVDADNLRIAELEAPKTCDECKYNDGDFFMHPCSLCSRSKFFVDKYVHWSK